MTDVFPKLRDEIDAAPAARDGETYYIIYDRSGVVPARLLVSPLALLAASRLDGRSSVLDVADWLAAETNGGGLACEEVKGIVDALAEALFLDDARFQDFLAQAERDFRAAPCRAAGSAGSAYPDSPEELAAELDRMLAEAPPPEEAPTAGDAFPRGAIAPHIDYARGAPGYGQLYAYLKTRRPPRTVVVIGTAHLPIAERFTLCDKPFATPLGNVGVDRDATARIREALSPHCDPDRDVLAHRGEHSIELQAVWLRHIYGDAVRIVPILAGSLGEFIEGPQADPARAAEDPATRALAERLAEIAGEGDTMLLASADLAHIGPRFGDDREIDSPFLTETETADRHYLGAVARDAAAGLASLAAHGDRYHVCGSACVFLAGLALPDGMGKLLGYHQAVTPEMRQAVTYASLIFE